MTCIAATGAEQSFIQLYSPGGALNSQTTESQYIEALQGSMSSPSTPKPKSVFTHQHMITRTMLSKNGTDEQHLPELDDKLVSLAQA
ncbi:hypothetical protein M422DRAFT_254149 [Sphaerobolus stellatus SS14]|uniref:Uncharacterized protein n=1 Tax=Sphaerobolus stellatus (strain SS14) TaxID=990650 RepID=A0A0C9VVK9_SPHS4|nr:hypothetical protein M422DRAFT_254149 [Sphaerobolus stellatus SS14]